MSPKAAPRPRARAIWSKSANKWIATVYMPTDYERWKSGTAKIVRLAWGSRPTFEGPVRLTLDLIFPRPKSRPKCVPKPIWDAGRCYKPTKPDSDNCAKAVLDSISDARICWTDDALVVDHRVRKWYAGPDEKAHVIVTLEPVW